MKPSTVRLLTLVYGIAFTLAGVGGFIPGLNQMHGDDPNLHVEGPGHGHLLGLFHVNVLHNLVHLTFGVWGLVAWTRGTHASRLYGRGVAIIYGVLVLMGLIPLLNTTFGLIPIEGHDVWLHLVLAIGGAVFGFMPMDRDDAVAGRTTTA